MRSLPPPIAYLARIVLLSPSAAITSPFLPSSSPDHSKSSSLHRALPPSPLPPAGTSATTACLGPFRTPSAACRHWWSCESLIALLCSATCLRLQKDFLSEPLSDDFLPPASPEPSAYCLASFPHMPCGGDPASTLNSCPRIRPGSTAHLFLLACPALQFAQL